MVQRYRYYHPEGFKYINRTYYIPLNSTKFFISLNNPVFSVTFLTDEKSCLNTKENLHVLLHSQYDNDLLGHLTPPIHNTASLFPTTIDILNSIYWPPKGLLYCLIKQSGNCFAFLKMSCCNLHFPPLLSNLC
jgi:hypothetical protein